jgi:hypothetical protein
MNVPHGRRCATDDFDIQKVIRPPRHDAGVQRRRRKQRDQQRSCTSQPSLAHLNDHRLNIRERTSRARAKSERGAAGVIRGFGDCCMRSRSSGKRSCPLTGRAYRCTTSRRGCTASRTVVRSGSGTVLTSCSIAAMLCWISCASVIRMGISGRLTSRRRRFSTSRMTSVSFVSNTVPDGAPSRAARLLCTVSSASSTARRAFTAYSSVSGTAR